MSNHGYRDFTALEKTILYKLLEVDIPGIQALRKQMAHATCRNLDQYGSIAIKVDNDIRSNFGDGPLISARQKDQDSGDEFGPNINILLFVKDGFLDELQIYKDSPSPIIHPLDPGIFYNIMNDKRLLPK